MFNLKFLLNHHKLNKLDLIYNDIYDLKNVKSRGGNNLFPYIDAYS